MRKSKYEEKPFLQYFWDEYVLFKHPFRIETELTRAEILENLHQLQTPAPTGWFSQPKRRTLVNVRNSAFEVFVERPARSGYQQTAKAYGEIYEEDMTTVLEGTATVNGLQFWVGIVIAFIFFSIFSFASPIDGFFSMPIMWIFPFIFGLLWWQMYNDRNQIINEVESVVRRKSKNSDYVFKEKRDEPENVIADWAGRYEEPREETYKGD